MFGKLGELAGAMKQLGQMRAKMQEFQSTIGTLSFRAESGGGLVAATVNGKMELSRIEIQPDAMKSTDAEMLEDLIVSAVSAAQRKAAEGVREEMRKMAGGLELPPGVEGMLGGAG